MLAGRAFCTYCGASMTAWGGGSKRADGLPRPPRYVCLRYAQTNAAGLTPACSGRSRLVEIVEADVREALLSWPATPGLWTTPRPSIAKRPPRRRESVTYAPNSPPSTLRCRNSPAQEAAAVQAQIAGIIAGASPDAYAGAFAEIAARRKDLQDRRGTITRQLGTGRPEDPKAGGKARRPVPTRAELEAQALEDAALVLAAPDVPGAVKRDIVARIVSRVECGEETKVFIPKEFTQETAQETGGAPETGNVRETFNIVLIGFMGTGKSAVGRNLARRLDARHLDTDAEIEREAGRPIPQIFVEEGEAAFRARESALLSSLAPPSFLGKGAGGLGVLEAGG